MDEFTWSDIANRVYREVTRALMTDPELILVHCHQQKCTQNLCRKCHLGGIAVHAGYPRGHARHQVLIRFLFLGIISAHLPCLICLFLSLLRRLRTTDIGALAKVFHVCEPAGLGARIGVSFRFVVGCGVFVFSAFRVGPGFNL